ncbi:STAS domain-containing protein [Streptomyces sp. NPDC001348]
MTDFAVLTQQYAERTVITVAGEIDLGACPELVRATLAVPLGGKTLQVDVSGVPFMDSSGLNLLLQLRRRLLAEGGRLLVTGLRHQPARLLHLTETYDLLTTGSGGAAVGLPLPTG